MKKLLILMLSLSLVLFFGVGNVQAEYDVELTIIGGAVGEEFETTVRAAEMYMEENPNVHVEVLDSPDSADERLSLYLSFFEAESPEVDVYQIDVIWPGELEDHFLDLYEYGAEEYVDMHFEHIVENNTNIDGELIAMPWFTDAGLLYYRKDLLDKYGLDVPETWAELEEYAGIILDGEREHNPDFEGFVWQGSAYEGLTTNVLEWFASNQGGTFISPEGVITVLNERNQEMLEMAAGWVGDISPAGITAFMEEDARAIWHDGNAAFMRNWPYAYSLSLETDAFEPEDFGVAPLPAGEDGEPAATLGGWNVAVSQYSEHPEEAADLAFFLAGWDVQKMRATDASLNPTIPELYEDEDVLEANPFMEELFDVFVNAVPRPSTVTGDNYSAASSIIYTEVHSVLTGEQDALTALEYMELELQDLTGFEIGQP